MRTHKFQLFLLSAGLPFLVLLSMAIVYWPIVKYPFVADDFVQLRYHGYPNFSMNSNYFDFFALRPITDIYTTLLFNLFGFKPVIFRMFLLLLHFMNSLFVAYIINKILKDRIASLASALLYAVAAGFHVQLLILAANGFADIGGVFFMLLSVILFLKKKNIISAIVFLLALSTKPSAAPLPLVLLFYVVLVSRQKLRSLWLHFAILCIFLFCLLRLFFSCHTIHLVDFSVSNIVLKWSFYLPLLVENFFPLKYLISLPVLSVILILLSFRVKQDHKVVKHFLGSVPFWIAWFSISLLFTCLITRLQTYYLVYSLIPFIALYLLFIRTLVLSLKCRYLQLLLWITVLFSVVSSSIWVFQEDKKGIDSKVPMIRGAYFVRSVQDKLLRTCPVFPQESLIILKGLIPDIYWYFGAQGDAISLLYRNNSLKVCRLEDLRISPLRISIVSGAQEFRIETPIHSHWPIFLVNFNGSDIEVQKISFIELTGLTILYNSKEVKSN